MSFGIALNCLRGVCEDQVFFPAILHKLSDFSHSCAHPRFKTISKMHRNNRPADWVMYTISADNEKPSKLMFEMYAWSKMFIFAVGSSILSFTGIGTRSANVASSIFSS